MLQEQNKGLYQIICDTIIFRSKCGIDMESWEQMINLHQAVTMLRNESGNQVQLFQGQL